MRTPVLMPSFASSFMDSSDSRDGVSKGLSAWPEGCVRARKAGGRRRRDLVEGEVFGGAAGTLLPVEEEAAVAVGVAGGGIDAEPGQGVVDPGGRPFNFGVVADGVSSRTRVTAGDGQGTSPVSDVSKEGGQSRSGLVWDHSVRNFS